MAKKLADDLIKSNTEYTKLRADRTDGESPREMPDHQSPGQRGLDRPEYNRWTIEELRATADKLNLGDTDGLDRKQLIERLNEVEQSRGPRR